MKVGLIDIEPKIFNTAYMQISTYHKSRGDTVEWWTPIEYRGFDVVYCSSLFDFTDKSEIHDDVICGGTGFDVTSRLLRVMEDCNLDYSIYPKCKTSYIWFSRGCNRDCPWCVVRRKEGYIHTVQTKNLNPNGQYITVMDNNFVANSCWHEAIQQLRIWKQPVDTQCVDVRTITEVQCKELASLKHHKQLKIAWDEMVDERKVLDGIKRLTTYIKPYKIMCYVLIGYYFSPDIDLYRVETLRDLGIDPFVMPYDRSDLYQRTFARWVNHKAIFKKVKWDNYRERVSNQEKAGCGWKPPRRLSGVTWKLQKS